MYAGVPKDYIGKDERQQLPRRSTRTWWTLSRTSTRPAGSYRSLVFYLEASESGCIFQGLLPENIDVYTTTAGNVEDGSWGTYCSGDETASTASRGWRTVTCAIAARRVC